MILRTRLDEITKGVTVDREKKKSKYCALKNARDWRGNEEEELARTLRQGSLKVSMRTR